MTNSALPNGVTQALAQAERKPGWNLRRGDVKRFTLPNAPGCQPCRLYVVPAHRWIYQRWERLRAERARGCVA